MDVTFSLNTIFGFIIRLCGQVVRIGGRNHPVSNPKYLTHQTSSGKIYVKSGKVKSLFIDNDAKKSNCHKQRHTVVELLYFFEKAANLHKMFGVYVCI